MFTHLALFVLLVLALAATIAFSEWGLKASNLARQGHHENSSLLRRYRFRSAMAGALAVAAVTAFGAVIALAAKEDSRLPVVEAAEPRPDVPIWANGRWLVP